MGYIDDNLVQGEQVIFRTRYHWYVIVRPIIGALVMIGVLMLLSQGLRPSRSGSFNSIQTVLNVSMLCLVPASVLGVLMSIISFSSSEFGVTNRRVLIKVGVLRRQTLELSLSKVESFRMHESMTGRLLGFNSITLTGSGGTHQRFAMVDQAREFRRVVTEMSTRLNDAPQTYVPPVPGPRSAQSQSLLDQLELPTEDTTHAIQQAVTHIRAGQHAAARQVVLGLTQSAPNNADVWYLAGFLASNPEQKRSGYSRALSLDPNHRKAREGLAALE